MIRHQTNLMYWPAALMVGLGMSFAPTPASADVVGFALSASVDGAPQGNSQALYASSNFGGENGVNGCSVGLCLALGDPTATITHSPQSTAGGLLNYQMTLSAVGSSVQLGGNLGTGTTGISLVSGSGVGSVETETSAGLVMEDGLTFHVAGGGTVDIGVGFGVSGTNVIPLDGSYDQTVLMSLGTAQLQWGASADKVNGTHSASVIEAGTENWVGYSTPVLTPTGLEFNGVMSVSDGQDLQFFLKQSLDCNLGASCDFFDPGQITLTLPAGVTFSSASGVFLTGTQSPSAVPEPGALWLTITCLAAVGLIGWKKRKAVA